MLPFNNLIMNISIQNQQMTIIPAFQASHNQWGRSPLRPPKGLPTFHKCLAAFFILICSAHFTNLNLTPHSMCHLSARLHLLSQIYSFSQFPISIIEKWKNQSHSIEKWKTESHPNYRMVAQAENSHVLSLAWHLSTLMCIYC